jgi:hypothetical protein
MTLDEALSDARATFPTFPTEIFSLWLDDRIKKNGWPPVGLEWDGFLFGESITYWQGLRWNERCISLSPSELGPKSLQIALQIMEAAMGRKNLISMYIPNTTERFESCARYIAEQRTLPGKILLLEGPEGYDVVEGNHRVAALLALLPQLNATSSSPVSFQAFVATSGAFHGRNAA